MNRESLCHKCQHLQFSNLTKDYFCKKRNCVNRYYNVVFITKGYKTCINFKQKEQQ